MQDSENCGCECGWNHYYLAGYYPKLGYLLFYTWLADWDTKNNRYEIPKKGFVEHGSYIFITLNGEETEPFYGVPQFSKNLKHFFVFTPSNLYSETQNLKIFTINAKTIKTTLDSPIHLGTIKSIRWISNNEISITKVFTKEKFPNEQVSLKFKDDEWKEKTLYGLRQFEDVKVGDELFKLCKKQTSQNKCLDIHEREIIAYLNSKNNYKEDYLIEIRNNK
jgi:hypothetical protein